MFRELRGDALPVGEKFSVDAANIVALSVCSIRVPLVLSAPSSEDCHGTSAATNTTAAAAVRRGCVYQAQLTLTGEEVHLALTVQRRAGCQEAVPPDAR